MTMIDDRQYREYYLRAERTAEQKRKDLVVAFDQIHELKCQMRGLKIKIWVLSGSLAALFGVATLLGNSLLECLNK